MGILTLEMIVSGRKTMQTDNENVRSFGMRDKVGYMFGDFGNDFTFIFASSF